MDFSNFNLLNVGILAINVDGQVIFANRAYSDFLGMETDSLLGLPVQEVLPHTNLINVARTGVPELMVWQESKQGYLCGNRQPLYENGKLIGAFAELLIQNTKELEEVSKKLHMMEKQVKSLSKSLEQVHSRQYGKIIHQSKNMVEVMSKIEMFAPYDTTVLIIGDTGTGKELIADALYEFSERKGKPFIKINCAAIPATLIESELFGYEKGTFTGAMQQGKIGKFEMADKGVLFLDEISLMPLEMQGKLLRVLQEKEIERLGSCQRKKIDVKIIAATNVSLEKMVQEKRFRQDLYFRLNVIELEIPPLRERLEDILLLANHFLSKYFKFYNKSEIPLSAEAVELFEQYSWPGNVRELKNVMEKLAIMCHGDIITYNDVIKNTHISINQKDSEPCGDLQSIVYNAEKELIKNALIDANGNKTLAAKKLNINRTTLYSKMLKYDI